MTGRKGCIWVISSPWNLTLHLSLPKGPSTTITLKIFKNLYLEVLLYSVLMEINDTKSTHASINLHNSVSWRRLESPAALSFPKLQKEDVFNRLIMKWWVLQLEINDLTISWQCYGDTPTVKLPQQTFFTWISIWIESFHCCVTGM